MASMWSVLIREFLVRIYPLAFKVKLYLLLSSLMVRDIFGLYIANFVISSTCDRKSRSSIR